MDKISDYHRTTDDELADMKQKLLVALNKLL